MKSPDTNNNAPEGEPGKSSPTKGAAGWAFLVGVVVFAVTQNPVWLAIGVAIGAAAGTAASKNRNRRHKDDHAS